MAKHMVKCYYCKEMFDANIEPYIKPSDRRYAHKACAEKAKNDENQEKEDKVKLENYIKELFGITSLTPKIRMQMNAYRAKNYTYTGMLKTLKYFYEVKGGSIEKAEGGIGIIPWVYDEAFTYWRAIWEAKQQSESVKENNFILPAKEIHILPPQRVPMKITRKLFTFLNEGESKI